MYAMLCVLLKDACKCGAQKGTDRYLFVERYQQNQADGVREQVPLSVGPDLLGPHFLEAGRGPPHLGGGTGEGGKGRQRVTAPTRAGATMIFNCPVLGRIRSRDGSTQAMGKCDHACTLEMTPAAR